MNAGAAAIKPRCVQTLLTVGTCVGHNHVGLIIQADSVCWNR